MRDAEVARTWRDCTMLETEAESGGMASATTVGMLALAPSAKRASKVLTASAASLDAAFATVLARGDAGRAGEPPSAEPAAAAAALLLLLLLLLPLLLLLLLLVLLLERLAKCGAC